MTQSVILVSEVGDDNVYHGSYNNQGDGDDINDHLGEDSYYSVMTMMIMIITTTTKVMVTTHIVILFSAGLMIDSNL